MTLELHATPQEVMRAVEAFEGFAREQSVPEPIICKLQLALEECASNIVNHALQRDALVLYSDGVTEAFNSHEECYGNDRLLADMGGFNGQSAPDITAGLLKKVRAFANGAPQSDDIAILTLQVNGGGGRA